MQMRRFGKRETAIVKGAAVVLMLVHHLFYQEEYLENCIFLLPHEKEALLQFAQMCKVCVAFFCCSAAMGFTKAGKVLKNAPR